MVGDASAAAFGAFERALLGKISKALATEAVDGQDVAAMRRTCGRLLASSIPGISSAVRSELSEALVDDAVRNARIAGIAVPDSMAASAEAAAASCAAKSRAVAGSMAEDAVRLYVSAKQTARMRMRRGADDAVRSTVADLADRGITAYSYIRCSQDGTAVQVNVSVDVGIRRTVCDTFYAKAQSQSIEIAGESTGLVEVSFSRSPRKSHAEWQGKVYSVKPGGRYPYFDDACHVGDPVDGFGGYNCQHELRVYDPRIGRMFSDPLEGTGYTREEARRAVGRQRSLENSIRKLKRRKNALDDAGLDTGNTDALISARQAELRAHISGNSAILRRERWREQVAKSNSRTSRTMVESGSLRGDGKRLRTAREDHANRFYREIRNRDEKHEVKNVSANSGVDEETVSAAYRHLFVEKHDLAKGRVRFDPDYEIAQSWQRLSSGTGIEEHDITLVKHEAYESELMKRGMPYADAHSATNMRYNYQHELLEYLGKLGE